MALTIVLATLLQAAAVTPPAPPASPASPPPVRARGTLFIAPSGEPFHGVVGETYPVVTWFARADADHDGKLTRSEFRRDFMSYFKVLDANGDGIVDAAEITRYEEELAPEVQVNFGGGPQFRSQPVPSSGDESEGGAKPRNLPDLPRGAGRYALINAPEPVVAADADLNRRISQAEYAASADRRFALLDPQDVGYLTLATLPKTPVQARAEARIKKPR
ncbi:hypothetical protein [Glacieibacterium sp.]|uniref:hypothetical protein n=1 Tax=Glacieibacterium sp. TaxID=2860237 RepID=UPI003B003D79